MIRRLFARRWKLPALLVAAALGAAGGYRAALPAVPLALGALPDVAALPPTIGALAARQEGAAVTLELWADLDPSLPVTVRVNGHPVALGTFDAGWALLVEKYLEPMTGRGPTRLRLQAPLALVVPGGLLSVEVETPGGVARRDARVDVTPVADALAVRPLVWTSRPAYGRRG